MSLIDGEGIDWALVKAINKQKHFCDYGGHAFASKFHVEAWDGCGLWTYCISHFDFQKGHIKGDD